MITIHYTLIILSINNKGTKLFFVSLKIVYYSNVTYIGRNSITVKIIIVISMYLQIKKLINICNVYYIVIYLYCEGKYILI